VAKLTIILKHSNMILVFYIGLTIMCKIVTTMNKVLLSIGYKERSLCKNTM